MSSQVITGNHIDSNAIGINGTLYSGYNGPVIENNLIYQNTSTGVVLTGIGGKVINNTIYQSVGSAVLVQASATNALIENNILWSDLGSIVSVASNSESGFIAAYNLFYQGGRRGEHRQLGRHHGNHAGQLADRQQSGQVGQQDRQSARSSTSPAPTACWAIRRTRSAAGRTMTSS